MIPSNIHKKHVLSAIKEIIKKGIPKGRGSTKFVLLYKGKKYPPKYVLSLANKFANRGLLDSKSFSGGQETNNFLGKLGFTVQELASEAESTKISKRSAIAKGKRHNERCPECKKAIESLLKKIYGSVKVNPKISISTDIKDYRALPAYNQLKKIKTKFERHRGFKDFVKVSTLPRCDYLVPNPGFLVEFDESQHFTNPRKMALQNYPSNLKLGFSAQKWISICKKTNAKDNNPPYRDEQRAWYDTLRDFLPQINNLRPTVRLYSKDIRWCSLNPKNPKDVKKFKEIIEGKKQKIDGWVATVILESDDNYSNSERLKVLSNAVDLIAKETNGDGVVLFPGGWFKTGRKKAKSLYEWSEKEISKLLRLKKKNIIACVGIDGRITEEGWIKDQIGLAISKKGIIAIGRKFHPISEEKEIIELAKNHNSFEENKSRIFDLMGKKYFICVCYDGFGIKHKQLPHEGIDVVLDLVHAFHPESSESLFARHGFAGTSNHWKCPVYSAVVFFDREIPNRWPSGVYWDKGDTRSKQCTYENITLTSIKEFDFKIKEGRALIRIFPN